MLTNIRYILITALRDRLFAGLLAGVFFAAVISATLGNTAFLEQTEMTIAYAAGSARIILMIGLIVFVCFHIRHAFDTKEIDVILSRPISRANLVLAYWLGFALVALLLALPVVAVIGLLGVISWSGYLGWGASLICETGLVVAMALFCALATRSAVTSVLACMGLYVLSRMMAFFIITANSMMVADIPYVWFKYPLKLIATIVPRLDFFSKTEWLVYGFNTHQDWAVFLLQSLVFIPLLILASIADFRRKQF